MLGWREAIPPHHPPQLTAVVEASWLRLCCMWGAVGTPTGFPTLRVLETGSMLPIACFSSPQLQPKPLFSTGHPRSRPQVPSRLWHFTVKRGHALASVIFKIVVKSTERRIYHPNPFSVHGQPCEGHLHRSGLSLKISPK